MFGAARWPTLLEDVAIGSRLLWRLPLALRQPIGPEQALAILRRRLQNREADFLGLVRDAIYANPLSPYRQLLSLAGCEYGDLERLVRRDGLEGALQVLYRSGVYLTVDELKGCRPIVRGGVTVETDLRGLHNPRLRSDVLLRSSGSRGAGTTVPLDLASIGDRAVNSYLFLDARGGRDWQHAQWDLPGAYVVKIIRYGCFGAQHSRWFSPLDPADPGLPPRYRWSVRALRLSSALLRFPVPALEYVPLEDPLPIVAWLSDLRRAGGTPCLYTFVSSAVRLAEAAVNAGTNLRGVQLTVTGEPITAARLAAIQRAGAVVVPDYGSTEAGGVMSYGCLAPRAPDDVHLMQDLHALIQPESDDAPGDLPRDALLMSSLRSSAPLILLNVSLGDQASVERRSCGCALERLGWSTHLHSVRSFEKLTAAGMTFLDTDVIRVLEEDLPARHGGGPTDYQLLEEEGADGRPRLRLLVRPSVGPLDPAAVAETFLAAIGRGAGAETVMAQLWRQTGVLSVERRSPHATASGKILHLVREDRTAPAGRRTPEPARR